VRFLEDGGQRIVIVRGLCHLDKEKAIAPFVLKPQFDTDRAEGRSADKHRYVTLHLLIEPSVSKEYARQLVRRSRKILAESYKDLFGTDPPAPMLIQNKPRWGYRLDPTIVLRADSE